MINKIILYSSNKVEQTVFQTKYSIEKFIIY